MRKHFIPLILASILCSRCFYHVPKDTCTLEKHIRKDVAKSLWLLNTFYYREFYKEHSKKVQEIIHEEFDGQLRVLVYEAHYHPTFEISAVIYSESKIVAFSSYPSEMAAVEKSRVVFKESISHEHTGNFKEFINGECELWQTLAKSYFVHVSGVESLIYEAACPNSSHDPCFLFLGSGELR